MNETSDLEKAIVAARHFETLLKERYRAWGNGLGGKTRSVVKNLRSDVVQNLLYVSGVSNTMRHEKVDNFHDKRRFETACAELENFFKEAIIRESPSRPSWLEPYPIGFWPRRLESSQQKRLFTVNTGKVTVFTPGTQWVRNIGGAMEAGYVCMLPLLLPRLDVSPLRSKDDLELRMSIELSAALVDKDPAIVSVVLTEEQQIETTQGQVLSCIQRICTERDYEHITRSLHEIADLLKTTFNGRVSGGSSGAFEIADCVIVECALEDVEIEETRRQQRRTSEDAKKKAEEQRHAADLERLQAQVAKDRTTLERQLAIESQKHENEIQKLRSEADTNLKRLEQELKKEGATHEAEIALAASAQAVVIHHNMAEAEMKGIPVAKAKAEVYSSPGGPEALYRREAYGLKELEIRKQMEVLRSILTDSRIQDFMKWARQSGVTETHLESLHNYQRLLEQHLGAPGTQINVPPHLELAESTTPDKDSPVSAKETSLDFHLRREKVLCSRRCKSGLGNCRCTPVATEEARRATDLPKLSGQWPTLGGSASRRAATRVKPEQASKVMS